MQAEEQSENSEEDDVVKVSLLSLNLLYYSFKKGNEKEVFWNLGAQEILLCPDGFWPQAIQPKDSQDRPQAEIAEYGRHLGPQRHQPNVSPDIW